jgi:hypothetical protein
MRKYSFVVLVALCAFVAVAAEPPRADEKDKPKTVVYDVNDLLYRKGVQNGYDTIDDLVKVLLTEVEPKSWTHTGDGNRLVVLGETKLEITAGRKVHEQIEDVLTAARGRMDLVVDVRGQLVEVERAYFGKAIKPRLAEQPEGKRGRLALDDKLLAEVREKALDSTKEQTTRLRPGGEGAFLSRRTAFTYRPTEKTVGVGYQGVVLKAGVSVSPDRRFVRLRLTQQVTEFVEINKETRMDPEGREYTREVPNLVERATTLNETVGDGAWLLVPVESARPGDKEKKTVLLALVHPRLVIAEEEREKLRQLNPGK